MGAELQRKREGKKTHTEMSEQELEKMASKPKSKKKSRSRPARAGSAEGADQLAEVAHDHRRSGTAKRRLVNA